MSCYIYDGANARQSNTYHLSTDPCRPCVYTVVATTCLWHVARTIYRRRIIITVVVVVTVVVTVVVVAVAKHCWGSVDPPQRMCTDCWGPRHKTPTPKSILFTFIRSLEGRPPQEQGAHDLNVYEHVCTCTLSEWQWKYIGLLSDSQEWSAHLSPVLVFLPRSRRTSRRRAARTCAPPRCAGRGAPPWPGRSPQPAARPCAA